MKWLSLFILCAFTTVTLAQDPPPPPPPRFAPPRPPMDNDFDDPIEEEVMPDQPNHMMPGVPMPNVGQVPTPPPPPSGNDFRPSGGGGMGSTMKGTGKIRFEILEGEYYEKGKPRGRAPINKR